MSYSANVGANTANSDFNWNHHICSYFYFFIFLLTYFFKLFIFILIHAILVGILVYFKATNYLCCFSKFDAIEISSFMYLCNKLTIQFNIHDFYTLRLMNCWKVNRTVLQRIMILGLTVKMLCIYCIDFI